MTPGSPATAMMTKTILLIEQKSTVREVLHLSLQDYGGWQVFSTGSVSEGLACAIRDRPDAIVFALTSVDRDIFSFLKKLQAQPETQHIPVVILTSSVKWVDSNRFQLFQVAGVIDYTADPSRLVAQIKTLLNWNNLLAVGAQD